MQKSPLLAAGAATLCLVAALMLVTGNTRTTVLDETTSMMAGGLQVTTLKDGNGAVAAVYVPRNR